MRKKLFLLLCIAAALASCKKEYITNEYITNEYITNEAVYTSRYYISNPDSVVGVDIRPDYLKKGDTVAVFAPSNAVTKDELSKGISVLKSWGLNVVEADNLYMQNGRHAGELSDRLEGMQKLLDNPNIRAIIAARGGYGATHLTPYLDWTKFERSPKWLVGFSDITVLHAVLNNKGIETIHGAMVNNMVNSSSVETLRKALFGELTSHSIQTNSDCIKGKATGRLVGGNLSIIYSLGGTVNDLNVRDAILLIEDTGEANYSIDRMMYNLKQSGKLDCVKGVVIGEFTNASQGKDDPINEIMRDHLEDLGIPVLYGINIGHDSENLATYLGREVELVVDAKKATITYK